MRSLILAATMAAVLALPAAGFAVAPDPNDPGAEPEFIYLNCRSKVTVDNATQLTQLTTLAVCPGGASAAHFNLGKQEMLDGTSLADGSFPKCNRLNDVMKLTFPIAKGLTTNVTSPVLGECLRGGVIAFSRPLL